MNREGVLSRSSFSSILLDRTHLSLQSEVPPAAEQRDCNEREERGAATNQNYGEREAVLLLHWRWRRVVRRRCRRRRRRRRRRQDEGADDGLHGGDRRACRSSKSALVDSLHRREHDVAARGGGRGDARGNDEAARRDCEGDGRRGDAEKARKPIYVSGLIKGLNGRGDDDGEGEGRMSRRWRWQR